MIDWDLAVSTGVRWARPGPQVSLAEARQAVAELRDLAAAVQGPVRELTGLPGEVSPGKVAVVDRPGWIRANVDGFRVVLDPLAEQMRQRSGAAAAPGLLIGVGSRFTGMQAGLILAYLSARVLGQYELFLPPGEGGSDGEPVGRLTLVAPNIVMVERELGVDPSDFRRWVCLHEETHRVQFTSVPWLRGYVQEQMSEFLLASDLDPATILARLRAAADAVAGAMRGGEAESLIEAIQTPRQREILDRLTALMTLVEGHGDYVMDAVGPQVVPSVAEIRERFNKRRKTAGRVEQAIRRLLGIDLKMRQYAEGAKFVRVVVDEIGMDGFNKVWESPQTIPTRSEIRNPRTWIARVAAGYAALPRESATVAGDLPRADPGEAADRGQAGDVLPTDTPGTAHTQTLDGQTPDSQTPGSQTPDSQMPDEPPGGSAADAVQGGDMFRTGEAAPGSPPEPDVGPGTPQAGETFRTGNVTRDTPQPGNTAQANGSAPAGEAG